MFIVKLGGEVQEFAYHEEADAYRRAADLIQMLNTQDEDTIDLPEGDHKAMVVVWNENSHYLGLNEQVEVQEVQVI